MTYNGKYHCNNGKYHHKSANCTSQKGHPLWVHMRRTKPIDGQEPQGGVKDGKYHQKSTGKYHCKSTSFSSSKTHTQ